MKNKEKYAKKIVEIACEGHKLAVSKETGKPVQCATIMNCSKCALNGRNYSSCVDNRKEWAESEYIEKPVISKRDRAFLEYTREEYKFVARDENGNLFVYSSKPCKDKRFMCWCSCGCSNSPGLYLNYNVDFPMVKWSDDKPWLIEDLKKLEVVDSYE